MAHQSWSSDASVVPSEARKSCRRLHKPDIFDAPLLAAVAVRTVLEFTIACVPFGRLGESIVGLGESIVGLRESIVGLRESIVGLRESIVGLRESIVGLVRERCR
jgi:hypothetical protein